MPVTKTCDNCGKVFSVPPVRKDTARFCSPQCKNEKRDWGKSKVAATCSICGKTFQTWGAWVKRGGGKYCSRSCNAKANGNKVRGTRKYDLEQSVITDYYVNHGLSPVEIGAKTGINSNTVRSYLIKDGVKFRTISEAQLACGNGGMFYHRGYVMVLKHGYPRANRNGYVSEHIYVWETTHDKPLPKGWVVHHKNGKRDDNRPENLEAMSLAAHTKLENQIRIDKIHEQYKERIRELEDELKALKCGTLTALSN